MPSSAAPGRRRAGGHGGDPVVVGVEDGGPAGRQRLHQLGFGRGHRVEVPEGLGVGGHHGRDHADARAGHLGTAARCGPGRGRPSPRSRTSVDSARIGQRERHAELVVERLLAGGRRPAGRHGRGRQVLGRRLADRTGDADDSGWPSAGHGPPGPGPAGPRPCRPRAIDGHGRPPACRPRPSHVRVDQHPAGPGVNGRVDPLMSVPCRPARPRTALPGARRRESMATPVIVASCPGRWMPAGTDAPLAAATAAGDQRMASILPGAR